MTDGTTDEDYRWRWLSTAFCLIYGLGLPSFYLVAAVMRWETPSAMVASILILVWGGTAVYIIGPENVKAFQKLRDGGNTK